MRKTEERIAWIDFAKFLGILFVLMMHADLKIPFISHLGGTFYVSIFFVLAGYTYQPKQEPFGCFLKRKAKRLLLPYFGYNAFLYLFFFVKDYILSGAGITEGTLTEALRRVFGILYSRNSVYLPNSVFDVNIMTILNSPTWFLTALFVSSVLFEIFYRICGTDWKKIAVDNVLIMAIGICIVYISPILLPWSLDSAFIFEIFIGVGYVLRKEMEEMRGKAVKKGSNESEEVIDKRIKNKKKVVALILFLLTIILSSKNGTVNLSVNNFGKMVSVGIAVSVFSATGIIFLCQLISEHIPKGAALIGQHSLIIMSLHMFVFMFIKTGINKTAPDLLQQDTIAADFTKTMMVVATMAVLTIGEMTVQYYHIRRKAGRGNNDAEK